MSKREDLLRHFDRYREETDRRVAEGIEKNRKGDVALRFVDGSGKPVQGARVKATLKKHAFLHGANLYELDQTESAEKNAAYREKFKEVFNAATVPIYWAPLEPEQEQEAEEARQAKIAAEKAQKNKPQPTTSATPARRKLSYKEQRELEELEKLLPQLESEKSELEEKLSSGTLSHEELSAAAARIGEIINQIEEKEMRWLELSEI